VRTQGYPKKRVPQLKKTNERERSAEREKRQMEKREIGRNLSEVSGDKHPQSDEEKENRTQDKTLPAIWGKRCGLRQLAPT